MCISACVLCMCGYFLRTRGCRMLPGVGSLVLWQSSSALNHNSFFQPHSTPFKVCVCVWDPCLDVCMPWPMWRSERGQLWVSPLPYLRKGLLWVCFSVTACASYLAFELLEFPCLCLSSHGTLRLQTSVCLSEILGIRTQVLTLACQALYHWAWPSLLLPTSNSRVLGLQAHAAVSDFPCFLEKNIYILTLPWSFLPNLPDFTGEGEPSSRSSRAQAGDKECTQCAVCL